MKELGDFWGIQFTRARTVFSGCHERPLWSKIAVFAFFLLIITKQLTHLMNSYCWSMWLMDGEQEIACCRDRLSLSVELTAELEKYQGAWEAAEMTKIEWHSLCIHLSFSIGPIPAEQQEGSKHGCQWREDALPFGTLVNGVCANTTLDSQTTPFLSFLSLGKKDKLGALMLPWLELHREGKSEFSLSLDMGKLLNESQYVPPIKEVRKVSFASHNQFNCMCFVQMWRWYLYT